MTAKLKNFCFSFFIVAVAGALCSYFTRWGVRHWYNDFIKPVYVPPAWFFSVAWGLIYAQMIASYYRILNSGTLFLHEAGRLFLLQLMLQVLWCILFFYKGLFLASFLVILWLIFTLGRMINLFLKIDVAAGALNFFGFLYICYAAFLSFAFLYANGYVINF